MYKRSGKPIEGFVDADWASEKEDRVSCSGYVIKFASGAVAWASRKQDCVATSTAEAEYVGLELCAKKAIVLHNILEHLSKVNKGAVLNSSALSAINELCGKFVLFNDNQSAVKNANSPDIKERSKHIDIKYHFVKKLVEDGKVIVKYCPTSEMVADISTKGLVKVKHLKCIEGMNMLKVYID